MRISAATVINNNASISRQMEIVSMTADSAQETFIAVQRRMIVMHIRLNITENVSISANIAQMLIMQETRQSVAAPMTSQGSAARQSHQRNAIHMQRANPASSRDTAEARTLTAIAQIQTRQLRPLQDEESI